MKLLSGSLAALAYGATQATERCYCNFGLDPTYRRELEERGLRVSGEVHS
ncbi:MAG: hypothetical protein M1522_03000 [Actinobacteria bacterium]|nr:hypothetical protein [Actinomycetota bacterium]